MQKQFKDVKQRLNHVEMSIAAMRRDQAMDSADTARQQASIDSLVERIQRIERRLELSE